MKKGRTYSLVSWGAAAAVIVLLLAVWIHLYGMHAAGTVHPIDRRTVVPKTVVDALGIAAATLLVLGIVVRAWRRTAPILVHENIEAWRKRPAKQALVKAAKAVLGGGMRDCEDAQQWVAHLFTLWGFAGLFATTSLDALVNSSAAPLPLLHPVRLLGNFTGILLMAGLTLSIARRALLAQVRATSHFADWTLLVSLWATGATGFLVQWFADAADARATAWTYVTHLVFVMFLLASAPWTKLVHAAWRPTWILYGKLLAERRP